MRILAAALAALILLYGNAAQAAWIEARTDHFIVYSQGSEKSVRDFAARLERFDMSLRKLHDLPNQPSDKANPLAVYVVEDTAAVARLCDSSVKTNSCKNIAGFYDGRVQGSVAFTPRKEGGGHPLALSPQIVLFHEYSHHIMLANYSRAYPAWFVEGFAEFNSTATFEKEGYVGFGIPAYHRYIGLQLGEPLPLDQVLTSDVEALKEEKRESLYGRGWLLTHYLTFERPRDGQLARYLEDIGKGRPNLDAARAAFGDLDQLDRELRAYLKRPRKHYAEMAIAEIPPDAVRIRLLGPGETAMMPIKMRSDRGVGTAEAKLLVAKARKAAAGFENDPDVQNILAEAEFDDGNDDLAEAASDRALKARPADRIAMIHKGQARMRRARLAGKADEATWKEVRSWFIKANRIEPDAAESLWLFYRSFQAQGNKPTENAVAGLRRAFELAPQDDNVRFMLARQFLLDGKLDDGRIVLEPLAYNPHANPDNPASKLIALIDKRDQAAIRAFLADRIVPAEPLAE